MGIAFKTDYGQAVVPDAQDQVILDFSVEKKELLAAFIHGQVKCASDNDKPVEEAVVKAVDINDPTQVFYALTDDTGFYALCVPPGTYDLVIYCCPEGTCTPVECTCGCQET